MTSDRFTAEDLHIVSGHGLTCPEAWSLQVHRLGLVRTTTAQELKRCARSAEDTRHRDAHQSLQFDSTELGN